MKRFIISLTIILIGIVIPYESTVGAQTTVLDRHWAYTGVERMVNEGIYSSSIISLNQLDAPITRAEASSIFLKFIKGNPNNELAVIAKDVSVTDSYYKSIELLIQNGIMHNQETIRPNDFLTKAEAAKLVMYTFQLEEDKNHSKSFSDVSENHWAQKYILTLADVSIIKGNLKGEYQPDAPITYAELSALLNNAIHFNELVSSHELIYNYLTNDYLYTINDFEQIEAEIITLINEYRISKDVSPLLHDPKLTQLAIIKVEDMIRNDYFAHYSPLYQMPWELAGLFMYEFHTFGENLARNFVNARDVVDAWIASPSHHDNLLKGHYEFIGIGIKSNAEGYLYFSNLFSGK